MKIKLLYLITMVSKNLLYGLLVQCLFLTTLMAYDTKAQIKSIEQTFVRLQKSEWQLLEIIGSLERSTDFKFVYPEDILDNQTVLHLKNHRQSVHDLLMDIASASHLKFKQVDNSIFVAERTQGEDLSIPEALQEQVDITGKVTDKTGKPIPGATVLIEGSTTGTATDLEGNFSLDVPEGAVLVISFIGYQPQRVTVGSQSFITVILEEDMSSLDEVVVVGYGEQERRDITGAVSSLKASDFEGEAISSLSEGMQGKTAGVNISTASGAPGGNMIVRIRGNNSVLGSNDPLYVIDGFPIQEGTSGSTNLLNTINPADIESIEVLKDASATAIYGSRGSNGVIIITTKQGSSESKMVNLEVSYGFQEVQRTIPMMDSRQYIDIANERQTNAGNPPIFTGIEELSGINTNWQDEIFQKAPIQNYSIRFSGGGNSTRYSITGNVFKQDGIIRESDFTRGSLRINLDQDITSNLTLSSRIYLSRSVVNEVDDFLILLSALQNPPFMPVRDSEGNYTSAAELKQFPFSPSTGENPVALANEQLNKRTMDRVLASLSARYRLTDDLSVGVLFGVDQINNGRDFYNPRTLEAGLPAGAGSMLMSNATNVLNENTLNFSKNFRENDKINITAGFTLQNEKNKSLTGASSSFVTDDLQNYILDAGEFFSAPSVGFNDWTLLSWLARINYSLEDKYLFTFSGRADGSSRFGEGNKWGYFPSGAFAWRLSDEKFIQNNLPQISEMKLRLSAGVSGNQAISPYQSIQRFVATSLAFGGTPTTGFVAQNLGNPNLRWETTQELNAGLEVALWEHRLYVTADFYTKTTTDLLALVNLPPTAGFASMLQNIGSIRNKGVEVQIKTDLIRGRDFTWDISLNAASNQNRVMETAEGQDIIAPTLNILGSANIVREGEPLGAYFGLKTNGLTEDGLFNYVDQNGDGNINAQDRVVLGHPYADVFYGLTTHLQYKNFHFRASVQGEFGKQLWNNNRYYYMSSFHRGNNQMADVADKRWRPENPNPNAPYPKATATLNQQPSDWFIEDASYLRLQNVRMDYQIPTDKIFTAFRSASIYVSAQNLLVLTGYSWYTPDINAFASGDLRIGIDQQSYPTARTVMLGINIGF